MKQRGFTLIEVVIGLAIFALAAVMLTQSFLGGVFSLAAFKYENVDEENLNFIYNQIMQLESREEISKGGRIESLTRGSAKWEARPEQTPVVDVYKLIVKVTFVEEKFTEKQGEVTETFYLYRPQWGQPSERENLLREKTKQFKQ